MARRKTLPGRMFVWEVMTLDRRPDGAASIDDWPVDFSRPNLCTVCGAQRMLFWSGGMRYGPGAESNLTCLCPLCGWHYHKHSEHEWYHDAAQITRTVERDGRGM